MLSLRKQIQLVNVFLAPWYITAYQQGSQQITMCMMQTVFRFRQILFKNVFLSKLQSMSRACFIELVSLAFPVCCPVLRWFHLWRCLCSSLAITLRWGQNCCRNLVLPLCSIASHVVTGSLLSKLLYTTLLIRTLKANSFLTAFIWSNNRPNNSCHDRITEN